MPKTTDEGSSATPEEILTRIRGELKSETARTRLEAIQSLLDQKFSSPAILHALEELALKDKSKSVREAARQALGSPTHRFIQNRTSKLNRKERQKILIELDDLENRELIQAEQADVIRRRYDFDFRLDSPAVEPASPSRPDFIDVPRTKPVPEKETPPSSPPTPVTKTPPTPKQPAAPRPSLTQTLLSETSIKIALYLGAFFVIAAAAILAAAVESARLPILFFATALFAGGALLTRKRLPQPSFALFVVFSFLLPTDANVLVEVLNLNGPANSAYWFVVMAVMALLWSFGTWFYASRLFSLAAFLALAASMDRLGELFKGEPEIYLLLLSFTALIGLGGTYILKRWKSTKFSFPLFILTQITQLGLILYALIVIILRIEDLPSAWNLASTFFWLLTAGFYILSDLVYPFLLFPWMAAAALYPVPLVFISMFSTDASPIAIATWIWGALVASGSELLRRIQSEPVRRYALPLLAGSLLVIVSGILIGFVEDSTYGFMLLVGSAVLYSVLQVLKPRVYVWVSTLLFGLGAYFSFFTLPFMEKMDVFIGYKFLAVSLFLLLPDLFLKSDLSASKSWRWPLRTLGTILSLRILFLLTPFEPMSTTEVGHAAVVFGVYAIFLTIYALRYNTSWIGYLATASTAIALSLTLRHFDLDTWLPALTGLAAAYYLVGWTLKKRGGKWSEMLRNSGLTLGGLAALVAIFQPDEANGWYIILTGALFTIEMFIRQNGWLEAGPGFYFPAALVLLLVDFDVDPTAYYLLGVSLLWLILDMVFARTFHARRPLALPIRGLSTLLVAVNTLFLIFDVQADRVAWICFGSYALFFLMYALVRKEPMLGYAFTTFLPLTIWYVLSDLHQETWVLPLIIPALVYYLLGFALSRRENLLPWSRMLRFSGLGLASLVSLAGVVTSQDSSGWYALLTALLFVVEMFAFRRGLAEAGIQLFFATGVYILLFEAKAPQSYQWLAPSLTLLVTDLLLAKAYTGKRSIAWFSRGFGAFLLIGNSLDILTRNDGTQAGAICLGIYTLVFLAQALLYRTPVIGYGASLFSMLALITTLKLFDQANWTLPVTALAVAFYGAGQFLRVRQPQKTVHTQPGKFSPDWPFVLWTSGLGAGLLATAAAPAHGGLSAAIPAAVTATMVAVEAFYRRNVWLGFPANALYLMAYFILLVELRLDEPQYFSIATAVLGLLMHYLLTRAGNRTGAFITGMVSQLVLLSTTYIQFLSTERLLFFAVLFFQALAVLVYGIVIRSRSLVITPVVFAVLSVMTALYGLLEGILPVILIGCTGIILLTLGIFAVVLRDRLKQISERFSDWGA